MKKYIAIALVASMGAALTGCNDFLNDNRYPKTSIVNSPEYWSNATNVQLQLDRFVDEQSAGYGSGGGYGWFYFKDLNDDQVGGGFIDWTYPTVPATSSDWSYSVIRGTEYVLTNIEGAGLSQADYKNFSGIARLVKAYAYYNLVRKFGDVVWVDKVVDPTDDAILFGPRTNRDEVMDYVIADLQYAVANIQKESNPTSWSQDYARAVLSEVALYEGTFCKYRTLAENNLAPDNTRAQKYLAISAQASAELLGKYGFTDDYHSIYNSLWQSQESTVVPGEMITGLSTNPELIFGRRYDSVNGRHSTISYTASSTTTNGMSLDAFKAFLFLDGTAYNGQSLEGENTTFDGYTAYSIEKLLQVRDKRLSIITDPYVYYKGMEWSRAGCSGMNASAGLGIAKYDNVLLPVGDRTNSANNYTSCPIYWTSYIALNYAEAKCELGQFGDAEFNKSLKKIYERAGLTTITNTAAMAAIQDPNRKGTAASNALLYEIRRCRRCELMFDNWIRYWDLIRWHELDRLDSTKNPDVMCGAYVANADVKPAGMYNGYCRPNAADRKFDKKYYLYPIPTQQRQLNPELGQNFGW